MAKFTPTALAILLPMALPVGFFILIEVSFYLGGTAYAHGPAAAFILLVLAGGFCVLLWELVCLPFFACRLRNEAALRTRLNVVALGAGLVYVCAWVVLVVAVSMDSFHAW